MDILKRKPQSPEMRQVIENIASVEEEIQEKIFQLGQMYYEENKDNEEIEPDFYAQIDLITKLDENRKSFYCHASNYSSHLRQLYRRLNSTSPIYCLS